MGFHKKTIGILIGIAILLFITLGTTLNHPFSKFPKSIAAVPVSVAAVIEKPVDIRLELIGTIQSYATVVVHSQVEGPIVDIRFKEGQLVHQNDVLFVIDPKSYEAQLEHAKATLARDQAQLEKAEYDVNSYATLVKQGAVSDAEFQSFKATRDAALATVNADKADVDKAELFLNHTNIRAPITGITGEYLAQLGAVVKADDTALVVINQIQPIYVAFNVPENKLDDIKNIMKKHSVLVLVKPTNSTVAAEEGIIEFVNNTVDPSTGTIVMKALLNNKAGELVPGQFVNVSVVLKRIDNALVIPTRAIEKDNVGSSYIFIVNPDLSVVRSKIVAVPISDSESYVESGVKLNDRVVTDGQFQLMPGSLVEIENGN